MKVTTSKGKTFDIRWMWGPVGRGKNVMLQLLDPRPLSQIAADFDGCQQFLRISDTEGKMEFPGYTMLTAILRTDAQNEPDLVQLTLSKPPEA